MQKNWSEVLAVYKQSQRFQETVAFVVNARKQGKMIFPENEAVFSAFKLCALPDLKVVILGQDPYHNIGQAHGLAFSVQEGVKIPPSLVNIFKELQADIGAVYPKNGNLSAWARQGVLLLNTVLTVEVHHAHSHANIGWEDFTDHVIKTVSDEKENVVFLLWGTHARKKIKLIDESKHLILQSSHPSPLSAYRGFLGCQHFSQTNNYLDRHGLAAINWQL